VPSAYVQTPRRSRGEVVTMEKEKKDKDCACKGGVTRRGFFASVGAGALIATTVGPGLAEPQAQVIKPEDMAKISLFINDRTHRLLVEPRWSLLYVLREKLGLTATKVGCERGECGACTVLMDGVPRYACLTLAVEAEGHKILTLEGLMRGEQLGPVQQAFAELDAFQCGYCTPGQIMAVEGLLLKNPNPSVEEIRFAVSGNLCRCGSYRNIVLAAKRAAELRSGQGGER
jgi:xanthine dehydrogenase YagT iron-sulfur-binding subunit